MYIIRKTFLIILAGIVAFVQSPGQGGFNEIFDNPTGDSWMRFEDIVMSNDTLTVLGTYGDLGIGKAGIIVAQFDTFGSYINHEVIVDSSGPLHLIADPTSQLTLSSRNTFLIPYINWISGNDILFCEMDANLKPIIKSKYTQDQLVALPMRVIELSDRYLIFGRIQMQSSLLMAFTIAINRNDGRELWRRYFGDADDNQVVWAVEKVNNNEIVIASGIASNSTDEEKDLWSQPWIFAIDSLGNILWQWRDEQQHEGGRWQPYNLRHISDGGWVFTPLKRHLVEVYPTVWESRYTPMLVKLDSAMSYAWEVDLNNGLLDYEQYFSDVELSADDILHIAGQAGIFYDQEDALAGRVMKLSTTTMPTNYVWEVIDTPSIGPSRSYLTGITLAPSGTSFSCGRTRNSSTGWNDKGWIIKITADGCIDTLCIVTSIKGLTTENPAFKLYPNPTIGILTIEAEDRTSEPQRIEIFDMHGRFVQAENYIGMKTFSIDAALPSALYAYRVLSRRTGQLLASGKLIVQ